MSKIEGVQKEIYDTLELESLSFSFQLQKISKSKQICKSSNPLWTIFKRLISSIWRVLIKIQLCA